MTAPMAGCDQYDGDMETCTIRKFIINPQKNKEKEKENSSSINSLSFL
jgi:hypothetical protein